MNEHMWKKLGEVKAFAESCVEFLQRGESGFVEADIFSSEEIRMLTEKNQKHIEQIDAIAAKHEATEVVNTKAAATAEKITTLRDNYLTDEDDWEDGMELLEWSGFFFGGAVVHWGVIRGASEAVHEADLTALAEGGATLHNGLLETTTESIQELARAELEA